MTQKQMWASFSGCLSTLCKE